MGGFFPRNSEFGTGILPFLSVCLDGLSAGPMLSEEVGEFMAEGALDFGCREGLQHGIDIDPFFLQPCPSCRRPHPRIPADDDALRE